MTRKLLPTLCALMLTLAAIPALAATPSAGLIRPGPPPLERFVAPLALTAEQQSKLRPIFAAAQAQAAQDVKDASAEGEKPDPARMAAARKMREADFRMHLATVLTPEQLSKFENLMADTTPREQSTEPHSAHGHRDSD
jgi:Spy/CpxP family protein refolding chaperone